MNLDTDIGYECVAYGYAHEPLQPARKREDPSSYVFTV